MGNITKTKLAYCENLIDEFIKAYPLCFSRENKKPLAVGIHEQLIKNHPDIHKKYIKKAIEFYTRTLDYYGSYAEHSHRTDLNGALSVEITEPEKAFAIKTIEKIKAKIAHEQQQARLKITQAEQAAKEKEQAEIAARLLAELEAEKAKNKRPILTLKRKPKA